VSDPDLGDGMVDADETRDLLRRAAGGDAEAAGALVDLHRERLRLMVLFRMDRRLRPRLGASDIVQEVCLEALQRLPQYLRETAPMPFFLWMRFLAFQRLAMLHRRHLGAKARAAGREVRLNRTPRTGTSSAVLAEGLAASITSPSMAVARNEMRALLRAALDAMDPIDREVLSLRHFEHLSNAETARELGLGAAAASKRYIRAFRRLRVLLAGPQGTGGAEASP